MRDWKTLGSRSSRDVKLCVCFCVRPVTHVSLWAFTYICVCVCVCASITLTNVINVTPQTVFLCTRQLPTKKITSRYSSKASISYGVSFSQRLYVTTDADDAKGDSPAKNLTDKQYVIMLLHVSPSSWRPF